MSHHPTPVLARSGHTRADASCRSDRRLVTVARDQTCETRGRVATFAAENQSSSVGGGTVQRSRAAGPPRVRPLIRVGVKELAIAGAVYQAYWFGRMLTRDSHSAASRNAERVIDLERAVGGFTELRLQRLAIDAPGMIEFLNRYYVFVHFPATIAFLLWVFAVRRHAYATIRCWFAAVTLAGLVIHVLFPLAPPRMTPGFVDTLDVFGPDIYTDDTSRSVANQFAAMPSLHFGWALIVAIGLGRLTRRRSRVWMAHPFITLLAIVVTGNHYWIDAGVAALLVAVAVGWWPGGPWDTRNGVDRCWIVDGSGQSSGSRSWRARGRVA